MHITINGRKIGDGYPVFFIAEAGVNHNSSMVLAKQLIDAAAEAGADAVKFQTFKTENIITPNAPKSTYHIQTTGSDKEQTWFELLKTQELTRAMHIELMNYCTQKNILFMSTPYDKDSADLLEELGVTAYKIASTDTNNIPFLKYVAAKGLPMILSSAMSTMEEVTAAVETVREAGLQEVAMLQCTGNYPARLEDSHLNVMKTYRNMLQCVTGYSDHTLEMINPVAATAMGAAIYEKHITIDKTLPGPDHRMALDPRELKETILAIRQTEQALGNSQKQVLESEKENRNKLRKSLVANTDIAEGAIITAEMLAIKRPGGGIEPSLLNTIIGKKALTAIESNSVLQEHMFA
ncbi:MAG: N-acetylneuraminate synthase [Chitinophagaceae bacterium]|nr:MAG: N-acetylneuraminate synthase [Chitinophagaceae bacterium]